MKTAAELREEIAKLMDRAKAITDLATAEKRDLSDEEKAEIDAALANSDKLEKDAQREEKLEAKQAELAKNRRPVGFQAVVDSGGGDTAATQITVPARAKFRYGALKAFRGPQAEERAYTAGQFFAATLYRKPVAQQWCRDHGIDISFNATLAEGADSTGGFLVPPEVEQAIIDMREAYGVFRQDAQTVGMLRDTKSQPVRASGVTAYFVGENSEITVSDKAWTQVQLTARKLGALIRYSTELSEDASISIGDDLVNEIAYAFAVKEDACAFLGDGSATYGHITGILNALAAGSVYTAITGNTAFSTLDLADFEAMIGKLPAYPGINPAWYISKAGWAASMMRLVDAAGGNTAAVLQNGATQPMFLGYPVRFCQGLNSTLTAQTTTKLLVFGDLRMGAILGDRRGIAIAVSGDRYFEYDQIGIRGTERFDINIHGRGDASNPGPILYLVTPGS